MWPWPQEVAMKRKVPWISLLPPTAWEQLQCQQAADAASTQTGGGQHIQDEMRPRDNEGWRGGGQS